MRKLTFLISIVFFSTLITSCGKEYSNPDPDPTDTLVTDADATSFINAAKITDTTQKGAIQALVKDLKDSSLGENLWPFIRL